MTDWTERLSEYLDGELSGDERARLDAALRGDAELRRLLEDLQAVKDTAGSLPRHPPELDLWPGIESRIEAGPEAVVVELPDVRRGHRRLSFTIPQLAAAAVAMLVLGSTSVWVAMNSASDDVEGGRPVAVAPAPEAGFVSAPGEGSTFSYEATIQDLEDQLRMGRDRLDRKEAWPRSIGRSRGPGRPWRQIRRAFT
jgi:anti-sigma factor RsiW